LEKKKVLVTGGAGFIGSHITDNLVENGYAVTVIDNLSTGKENNLNKKAKFYKSDIKHSQLESIFQTEQPDYVCHQAAQVDVRRSVADPIFDADINVIGTINILQNCIKYKVKKIVFASSGGAVYGEQEIFPAPETHPLKPISPYGITKLVAEHYLYYYRMVHGLNYVALRYANVYGPRQDPFGEAGVVAIFIQKMLNGEQPVINGDGGQTRDFVYVGDVARANIKALQEDIPTGPINIGTGIETSIIEIFEFLRSIISPSVKKQFGPPKLGEQRRSVVDVSKAKEILKWEPQVSISEGLKKTCEYFQTP
jgi:UDP-glucose 4-epimerase